jgi:O-antigen/teichoic acid export membrane protein
LKFKLAGFNKVISGSRSNTVQVFWLGMGSFSSFAVSLLTAAILSRYLDKTEYGTYKQILYVYNTLLLVFTAGLPRVFSYFLPRYTLAEGKEIVIKISKVLVLAGLAFSICLYGFSGIIADILKNPELSRGLKHFSPVPALLLPSLGIEGIFTTYKKTIFIAVYKTVTRTFMLIIIVLPVIIFSRSYLMAIHGWVVVSIIILIMAYVFKNIPFRGVVQEKSTLKLKEIFSYSLPLVAASIAGTLFHASNQFYVSRFYGPEVFAEFSNGFVEIPFVRMITASSGAVLMPIFAKIIHEKSNISEITSLWTTTLKKSAVLIYPMVLFFMFYSKELVTIVYSKTYEVSSIYFSIAMILNFFNIIVFAPLLLSLGESKFYARLHYILAMLAWVFGYIVVKIFDTPVAIAISFVLISIAGIIISLAFSAKKLGVSFFQLFPILRLLYIAMHSFLSLFVVNILLRNFLVTVSDIPFLAIAGVVYILLLVLTSRLFNINYFEIIRPLLKRKMNKKE